MDPNGLILTLNAPDFDIICGMGFDDAIQIMRNLAATVLCHFPEAARYRDLRKTGLFENRQWQMAVFALRNEYIIQPSRNEIDIYAGVSPRMIKNLDIVRVLGKDVWSGCSPSERCRQMKQAADLALLTLAPFWGSENSTFELELKKCTIPPVFMSDEYVLHAYDLEAVDRSPSTTNSTIYTPDTSTCGNQDNEVDQLCIDVVAMKAQLDTHDKILNQRQSQRLDAAAPHVPTPTSSTSVDSSCTDASILDRKCSACGNSQRSVAASSPSPTGAHSAESSSQHSISPCQAHTAQGTTAVPCNEARHEDSHVADAMQQDMQSLQDQWHDLLDNKLKSFLEHTVNKDPGYPKPINRDGSTFYPTVSGFMEKLRTFSSKMDPRFESWLCSKMEKLFAGSTRKWFEMVLSPEERAAARALRTFDAWEKLLLDSNVPVVLLVTYFYFMHMTWSEQKFSEEMSLYPKEFMREFTFYADIINASDITRMTKLWGIIPQAIASNVTEPRFSSCYETWKEDILSRLINYANVRFSRRQTTKTGLLILAEAYHYER